MKKIIYLFCLICTITLAKGQYYRPDRGFYWASMPDIFTRQAIWGNMKNGILGKRTAKSPN